MSHLCYTEVVRLDFVEPITPAPTGRQFDYILRIKYGNADLCDSFVV